MDYSLDLYNYRVSYTVSGADDMDRHSLADYKLLSVHVMIRHGDRYPLYSIPQTKRPAIDCTLSPYRCSEYSTKLLVKALCSIDEVQILTALPPQEVQGGPFLSPFLTSETRAGRGPRALQDFRFRFCSSVVFSVDSHA
ncbi:hypothetical protein NFI96_001750 [Prochilodus magdalenae]|nr:hypothetical protein NFI96_001750 [Prochilodus magdalenae]